MVGPMPREHAREQVQGFIGYGMTMRIGEEGSIEKRLCNRRPASQVHLLHGSGRQPIDEAGGIEAMVSRIEANIFDIEQKPGARLGKDKIEKRHLIHLWLRPFEDIGDVLKQERNRNNGSDCTHLRNDRFGNRDCPRKRHQVHEIAAWHPREGEMLAIGTRAEPLDRAGNLIEIENVERHIGSDGKPDTVRDHGNFTREVEDAVAPRGISVDAMIDDDFERIEPVEVLACPRIEPLAISDADAGLGRDDDRLPSAAD